MASIAALQQCSSAAVQQCSSAAVQQCSSAAVQQCSSAAVQQYHMIQRKNPSSRNLALYYEELPWTAGSAQQAFPYCRFNHALLATSCDATWKLGLTHKQWSLGRIRTGREAREGGRRGRHEGREAGRDRGRGKGRGEAGREAGREGVREAGEGLRK